MPPGLIYILISFIIGATLAFFYRGIRIARLETELASEKKSNEKIDKDFRLTASEVLQNTTTQFLTTALKDLGQLKSEINENVDHKKELIANAVNDMKSRLEDYQAIVRKFEEERFTMYAKLDQSLVQILNTEEAVRLEASALKRVLTHSTGIRGKWGEKILQEILEQNNLVRGIHFETQSTLNGAQDNDLRPDFIIHLPGGKRMIVDSKEVAGEYILAQDTDDPERQKEHYQKLVVNIRNHFTKLSRKEYQAYLDPEVPFVVMFIPSEAAIRAAFATDPEIFQDASQKRVILASPMTIVPLIYLVAHSWQQHKLAENARELGVIVEELGNRICKFVDHLMEMRSGIQKTSDSWDKAVGSWEARVAPQITKAKLLGGKLKEIETLAPIEAKLIGGSK